jgi:hypothetical protein
MPAMMDVIFSMILGFTIILIIFNANIVVGEGWFYFNSDVLVQEMLISTATLLEGEFRNMGYRVQKGQSGSTGVILHAGESNITFAADINNDGYVNEVAYYLGPLGELSFQNEGIRRLYRRVDSVQPHIVGLVTEFRLRYFDRNGEEIPVPATGLGHVYMIEVEMEVQHPHALYTDNSTIDEPNDGLFYSTTMWRQSRLGSKNFSTR